MKSQSVVRIPFYTTGYKLLFQFQIWNSKAKQKMLRSVRTNAALCATYFKKVELFSRFLPIQDDCSLWREAFAPMLHCACTTSFRKVAFFSRFSPVQDCKCLFRIILGRWIRVLPKNESARMLAKASIFSLPVVQYVLVPAGCVFLSTSCSPLSCSLLLAVFLCLFFAFDPSDKTKKSPQAGEP